MFKNLICADMYPWVCCNCSTSKNEMLDTIAWKLSKAERIKYPLAILILKHVSIVYFHPF